MYSLIQHMDMYLAIPGECFNDPHEITYGDVFVLRR